MRWRGQRTRFLVATLALLVVGAMLAGASLNHTTVVLPNVVIAPVGLELAGTVGLLRVIPAQDVVVVPDRSRAPPLA